MGLMLAYKKYQICYIDNKTNNDFKYNEIYKHPDWRKEEYDNIGNIVYREYSDGSWIKIDYVFGHKEKYREYSNGEWIKYEYDNDGNFQYRETSWSGIDNNY